MRYALHKSSNNAICDEPYLVASALLKSSSIFTFQLSLADNSIRKITGLTRLCQLTVVNLANNDIATIDGRTFGLSIHLSLKQLNEQYTYVAGYGIYSIVVV